MENRYSVGTLEPENEFCISDAEEHIIIARGGSQKMLQEIVDFANKGSGPITQPIKNGDLIISTCNEQEVLKIADMTSGTRAIIYPTLDNDEYSKFMVMYVEDAETGEIDCKYTALDDLKQMFDLSTEQVKFLELYSK